MKNEAAFADLHARFLTAAPLGISSAGWLKTTSAIAIDVICRALQKLRAEEGLSVGVYFALTEPAAADSDPGWARALDLLTLKYVNSCGRVRVHASYPRNRLRNALLAPEWHFPDCGVYPERETYSIQEHGCFRAVEHVEALGVFHRIEWAHSKVVEAQ